MLHIWTSASVKAAMMPSPTRAMATMPPYSSRNSLIQPPHCLHTDLAQDIAHDQEQVYQHLDDTCQHRQQHGKADACQVVFHAHPVRLVHDLDVPFHQPLDLFLGVIGTELRHGIE